MSGPEREERYDDAIRRARKDIEAALDALREGEGQAQRPDTARAHLRSARWHLLRAPALEPRP